LKKNNNRETRVANICRHIIKSNASSAFSGNLDHMHMSQGIPDSCIWLKRERKRRKYYHAQRDIIRISWIPNSWRTL